jgi:hypothetical protein
MIKTPSFQLRKIFIIVAASLILPALAQAKGIQWDNGDKGEKGEKSDKDDRGGRGEKGDPRVSSVPETSTAWVLLPFVGAVLVFSTRRLFLKKATE